jgi:hypothetical protein
MNSASSLCPGECEVARRIEIPGEILREMQRDGALPPWVMVVGSPVEVWTVDPTPNMEAWCEAKVREAPTSRSYRVVGDRIRKSLAASQILTCAHGHRHPPEPVWVCVDNPRRPRPFHCAAFTELKRGRHREDYWQAFDRPAITGRRPCRVCFPPAPPAIGPQRKRSTSTA